MLSSKARWMQDSDGVWLSFLVSRQEATEALDRMQDGKTYTVTVKEHKERRSLDANAYFWVLAGKLAERLRIPKEDIYRRYIREIGGNSETVCVMEQAAEKLKCGWEHNGLGWLAEEFPSKIKGCVNVTLYYGSSTYDTTQMSRLIDMCVEDCKEYGIETATERELSLLKENWGNL